MKLELHAHSHYSRGSKIPAEGTAKPREIVKRARELGIGGVAITDHDSIRAWKQARDEAGKLGILFIPAVEVSSADGHVVGLGVNEKVPRGLSAEETIDRIRAQGGVAVAPHPFDVRRTGIRGKMRMADAVEVFNSLAVDRHSNMICERKLRGTGKPLVAGSDAHSLDMVGNSLTVVRGGDLDEVLKAIKRGRTKLETSYTSLDEIMEWTRIRMIKSYMDVIRYIDRKYNRPKASITKAMLRKFILSNCRCWKGIAGFSLGATGIYSGMRSVRYIK